MGRLSGHKGRSLGQRIDWTIIFIYLALVFIGWVNIFSSVQAEEPAGILDFSCRCGKQFIWILTSFGIGAVLLFMLSPKIYEPASAPVYLLVLLLLVAVIFLGTETKGSRSWFEFGPIKFQPAEISKISTSMILAAIMGRQGFKLKKFGNLMLVAAIILVPMTILIVGEKETGSALVYCGFVFAMYREGLSGWFIALAGLAVLLFIVTLTGSITISLLLLIAIVSLCSYLEEGRLGKWIAAWLPALIVAVIALALYGSLTADLEEGALALKFKPIYFVSAACLGAFLYFLYHALRRGRAFNWGVMATFLLGTILVFSTNYAFNNILQDHQRNRIEVLLGMKDDPMGVGYNVNQSMIAIGSGGLHGKGYLEGTQTVYGFVPEQSTDFIFCTIGEEWGFIGCLLVIALYVALIWRIVRDSERSREAFTRIYGYCTAGCIFMHLFINIGMTIGIMPVIGIPLPLISYGGSSLWAFTAMIFIFLALYKDERKFF